MSLMAISRNESWPTGGVSSPESTGWGQVVSGVFFAARPLPLPNSVALDDLVAESERDAVRFAALAEARRALGGVLFGGQPTGLAALRLRAGLSQSALAERARTSQAHIAKIEAGRNDPGTQLVARLAGALGVGELEAFSAIRVDQSRSENAQ